MTYGFLHLRFTNSARGIQTNPHGRRKRPNSHCDNQNDSILEWIRQCEITFESSESLRGFLHPDVWPHAGRSSFVNLLMEKSVPTHGVGVENAVGLRLTFRQPPPIDCFSNQFLFYLNSTLTTTAYRTWARLAQDSPALFPPDRFHFQVVEFPSA